MKSTCKKTVTGVLLTTCVFWNGCGKDNRVVSTDNVANTNFVGGWPTAVLWDSLWSNQPS